MWHHGSFIFLIIYRCIRSAGFCLFLHLTKLHSKLHLFHYFVFLSVVFFLFVYCSLNFFPVKIGLINILTFSTHALNHIFHLLGMINGKNPNLSATNFGNRPQDVVTKRNPGESENSGRALPLK